MPTFETRHPILKTVRALRPGMPGRSACHQKKVLGMSMVSSRSWDYYRDDTRVIGLSWSGVHAPFGIAVPFWGQTSLVLSSLFPNRDCSPRRVKWAPHCSVLLRGRRLQHWPHRAARSVRSVPSVRSVWSVGVGDAWVYAWHTQTAGNKGRSCIRHAGNMMGDRGWCDACAVARCSLPNRRLMPNPAIVAFYIVILLRGTKVNRTYDTHKNLYACLFLLTIFGPINYGPP